MFEIGKIPPQRLERIVLDPVTHSKVHRDDIVVRPKTGEDCSAMDPKRNCACSPQTPSLEQQRIPAIWRYISTVTMYFPQGQSLWGF